MGAVDCGLIWGELGGSGGTPTAVNHYAGDQGEDDLDDGHGPEETDAPRSVVETFVDEDGDGNVR